MLQALYYFLQNPPLSAGGTSRVNGTCLTQSANFGLSDPELSRRLTRGIVNVIHVSKHTDFSADFKSLIRF